MRAAQSGQYAVEDIARDPGSGVAYGQHDILTRRGARNLARSGCIQDPKLRFKGQFAAVGHRIAGVDAQVYEHVMQLRGIAQDARNARAWLNGQPYILGKARLQDLHDFGDQVRRLEREMLAVSAPGEVQQVLDDIRTAFGAGRDGIEHFRVFRMRCLEQDDCHHDGRQRVVQVVSHSAGQGADALHVRLTPANAGFMAVPENLAILDKEGACVMIHSDDANGIQRLNQEVAKAMAAGRREVIRARHAGASERPFLVGASSLERSLEQLDRRAVEARMLVGGRQVVDHLVRRRFDGHQRACPALHRSASAVHLFPVLRWGC